MTKSGGSVALHGFLYQIIHHLHWATSVSLTGTLDGQDVKDGCLVLEPAKGGGDAQARVSHSHHLVEQYKTRTSGTWSLANVSEVLGELRKSVPESPRELARYRFVTNGRAGRLSEFREFIARLGEVEDPDDLDNTTKRNFGHELLLTDRVFLDHLTRETRNGVASEVTSEERALVFHLVRRFELRFEVQLADLVATIEKRLRPFVRNLGDETGVRKRLVGELIERLGSGEMTLGKDEINAMLKEAGVGPDRLRKVRELAQTLAEARRQNSKYIRYRSQHDVREVPRWGGIGPVFLIAGESGVGKSWQLASLMKTMAAEGEPVVFVRGANRAEDVLTSAAQKIWQVALGETSDKTLQGVSNFLREEAFQLRSPRFTIAVDDVGDADVVRDLVRQDWTRLGGRLVMTVPHKVAGALGLTDQEEVEMHHVSDFSFDELDTLFRRFGRRWSDLPGDLKRQLRKPVLAGIFLDLRISSFQNAPQSEYEIFEAFWNRIDEKCSAGDKGIVTALADCAVEGERYPLPREDWSTVELDNVSLAALEGAGWLTCSEYGAVEFAHDRLLNWAVAQSVCRRILNGKLTVDELTFLVAGEKSGSDSLQRLDYVPMDTLWLLSAEDLGSSALGQLVERMESDQTLGGGERRLYTKLLPTLGQRAVPILRQRLEQIIQESMGDQRVGLIGEGFAALARQESVNVRTEIEALLWSQSWDAQSVAVAMLSAVPDPQHMDRLWEVHQQRCNARECKTDRRIHLGYQATLAALGVGMEFCPDWLRDRILEADPAKERISELGYLLAGLDGPKAGAIWREARDELVEKVPDNNPRCLLLCVARFSDQENKGFVIENLWHQDQNVSVAAMETLAILDPGEAILRIGEVDDRFIGEWLPLLLRADSERTRTQLRELAEANSEKLYRIEDYFKTRPADLDSETFELVLRIRERQFQEHKALASIGGSPWPRFALQFLGRMCRPSALRRLSNEAGGALEAAILEVACSRCRIYADGILEAVPPALVLIGGQGIVDLVNRALSSGQSSVRQLGLYWARVRGNERTIELLAEIARDANGEPNRGASSERNQATVALAVLGADEILVELLSSPGFVDVPLHLAELVDLANCRMHRGPMSKPLTAGAVRRMRDADTPIETLLGALVVAWLSGDADLIPDVRDVLDRVDPESEAALHACAALHGLGDRSPVLARAAETLAFSKQYRLQGLNLLIGLGAEGVGGLKRWLCESGCDDAHLGASAIRALFAIEEGREDAISAAADLCLRKNMFLRPIYEIAAEAGNRVIREKVLEEAFTANPVVVQAPLDAMLGLAKFDPVRAAEAVEVGLSNHPKIERDLCRLLVRLEPDEAAEKLVGVAVAVERESLSDAVGRALRFASEPMAADAVLKRLFGTEAETLTACRIAGWLPFSKIAEALERVVERDGSLSARRAALDAQYRHREEASVRDLLSEFETERCQARRWALFISILEAGDPHLLRDQEDRLSLGHVLKGDVPYAFERHACEVIKRRIGKA